MLSGLILYFIFPSLKKQSKPLVKGSKYQTLPGKLPRPLQNGDQGAHHPPDGCSTNGSEDSSVLGLSMYPRLSRRDGGGEEANC